MTLNLKDINLPSSQNTDSRVFIKSLHILFISLQQRTRKLRSTDRPLLRDSKRREKRRNWKMFFISFSTVKRSQWENIRVDQVSESHTFIIYNIILFSLFSGSFAALLLSSFVSHSAALHNINDLLRINSSMEIRFIALFETRDFLVRPYETEGMLFWIFSLRFLTLVSIEEEKKRMLSMLGMSFWSGWKKSAVVGWLDMPQRVTLSSCLRKLPIPALKFSCLACNLMARRPVRNSCGECAI